MYPDSLLVQTSTSSPSTVFRAEVYVDDDKVAEAEGRSKKEAKRKAAKKALFLITN